MARGTRPLLPRLCGAALVLLVSAVPARADDNVAEAASHNDATRVLQLLGGGTSPDEIDDNGRTGLEIAAMNANLQIAAILIKAKAHLDVKDKLGNTALHYAADRNHTEMAQLLLDAGVAVDPQNKIGMTPLMIAADRGNPAIVQALLAKGADVRKADYSGHDALAWAADSHRPVIVQMLQRALATH